MLQLALQRRRAKASFRVARRTETDTSSQNTVLVRDAFVTRQ